MKRIFTVLIIFITSILTAQDFQVTLTNEYSVDPPHLAINGKNAHIIFGTNFGYYKFNSAGPSAPIDTLIKPAECYGPLTTDIAVDPSNPNNLTIIYDDYHYDYSSGASFYGCYVVQSNDGGTSWGAPVLLDTIQYGNSIGNLLPNVPRAEYSRNGDLFLLWNVHTNGVDTNALYLSKNLGNKIRADKADDNGLEVAVSLFVDGDIVAISYGKTEDRHVKFYLKYSTDKGATFSDDIMVKDDGDTFITSDNQTNVFMNGMNINYVYSSFSHSPKLLISNDGGVNWRDGGTVEAHKYIYVALGCFPGTGYYVKLIYDDNGDLVYSVSTDLITWSQQGKLNSDAAKVTGEAGSFIDMVVWDYKIAAAWIDTRTGNEEIFYSIQNLPTIDVNEPKDQMPKEFNLLPNYPNPFNPSTNISYQLPNDSQVKVEIFNTLGERIDLLVDNVETAGLHTVSWNASYNKTISSGIYIAKLTAVSLNDNKVFSATRKMMLLK